MLLRAARSGKKSLSVGRTGCVLSHWVPHHIDLALELRIFENDLLSTLQSSRDATPGRIEDVYARAERQSDGREPRTPNKKPVPTTAHTTPTTYSTAKMGSCLRTYEMAPRSDRPNPATRLRSIGPVCEVS